jgi:hypothetical protein
MERRTRLAIWNLQVQSNLFYVDVGFYFLVNIFNTSFEPLEQKTQVLEIIIIIIFLILYFILCGQ